jgi:hypothetical protein
MSHIESSYKHLFPIPRMAETVSGIRSSKTSENLCDYAESYLQLKPEEMGPIPNKFRRYPKHPVMECLWVDIVVNLNFFAQWSNTQDNYKYFPKGVRVLIDSSRNNVLEAVSFLRTRNWAKFVECEYINSLERCEGICAAEALGHWPENGSPRIFTQAHVKKAMKDTPHSLVGVVDYGHIYTTLLKMAIDSV